MPEAASIFPPRPGHCDPVAADSVSVMAAVRFPWRRIPAALRKNEQEGVIFPNKIAIPA